MFGYIAATNSIDIKLLLPALGILLLACGSAAINHFQETKNRFINGENKESTYSIRKNFSTSVLYISLILVISGSVLLFVGSGILALALGLLNLIWYNGIYTP